MRTPHVISIVFTAFLAGCGQDRLAGGSSSTGNALTARVVHADGSSAEGDSVILRVWNEDGPQAPLAVAFCDPRGQARFSNLPSGPLSLEARGIDQGRFATIRLEDPHQVVDLSSDRYATLSGAILVADSVKQGRAHLVGTGLVAELDDSGRFRLDRVSPGIHRVTASPRRDASLGIAAWKEVPVGPREALTLETSAPIRPRPSDWTLSWQEDFLGLDSGRWSIDTGDGCPDLCQWGKGAMQRFLPKNVHIREGALVLAARKSNQGWTSGQIQSMGKVQIRQGRLEVEARLPGQRGAWSLISLQGDSTGRVWPQSGAIDIASLWGYRADSLMGIAHFSDLAKVDHHPGKAFGNGLSWTERKVTYAIEWNDREILWLADDQVYFRIPSNESFHHTFYLSLGLTVGGDGNVAPSDTSSFEMVVEAIRFYQRPD